jgi:hypothetical protein
MEFNDFLNKYKEEALQVDLKKEQYLAYEILELKKMKLNNVTFEYEIDEVIAFCEQAITGTKEVLNRAILNKHYNWEYTNCNPLFLSQMKGYFEYIELYHLAISKKGQHQQNEAVKPDELLKNPNETIFKDDFAFTLFDKMKQHYSDTKTPQADYSFLFDIMQNDGFVICTGKKFVGYLVEDFDIKMTKIDSFKTGNKQKTKLYIATKENLQKKHGLSTI